MFFKHPLNLIVFSYFVLIGITWVGGTAGEGISGRLAAADILGLVLVSIAFLKVMILRSGKIFLPASYKLYIIFLLVLTVGVFLSDRPELGLLEVLVHLYIFFISLSLLNIFKASEGTLDFSDLLGFILFSGFVLAFIALTQFLVFPNLFQSSFGGLSGTFRNTGQAGSFFALFLALIVPGFLSGLLRPTVLNYVMATVILVALILTFKRAAWIGFLLGVVGLLFIMSFSFSVRDKKIALYFLLASFLVAPIGLAGFFYAQDEVDGVSWRFESKINAEAGTEFVEGFFADNLEASMKAFSNDPLLGAGAANIAGVYTEKYEIHSTYLKIIGTTGILGSITYLFFMLWFSADVFNTGRLNNIYAQYLRYFFPFFLGLMVSWSYTYHLRKREFWVAFALVAFCSYLAKRENKVDVAGCKDMQDY